MYSQVHNKIKRAVGISYVFWIHHRFFVILSSVTCVRKLLWLFCWYEYTVQQSTVSPFFDVSVKWLGSGDCNGYCLRVAVWWWRARFDLRVASRGDLLYLWPSVAVGNQATFPQASGSPRRNCTRVRQETTPIGQYSGCTWADCLFRSPTKIFFRPRGFWTDRNEVWI